MLSTNIMKLPWEKLDAWAFCFVFVFFVNAQASSFFNSLTCDLRGTMPRQRSLMLFTHMWLTRRKATPEVTHALHSRSFSHPTLSSLTLPWTIARFLNPFYTFSPAQRRVIRDFAPPPFFTVSATDLRERFLLSGVFYLTLLIPREAEDFPRGDRHFKQVPPPTYLICLSPKELYTIGLFKPYGRSNLWRICSWRDSNSFHDKRSMLKVLCHIYLATELDDL